MKQPHSKVEEGGERRRKKTTWQFSHELRKWKKKHSVDSQRLSLFALLKRCMLKAYKFVQARSFCEFSLCCSCSYSMISASTLPALWFWRVTEGNVSPSVFTTLVSCQARSAQHYKVNLTTRLWETTTTTWGKNCRLPTDVPFCGSKKYSGWILR